MNDKKYVEEKILNPKNGFVVLALTILSYLLSIAIFMFGIILATSKVFLVGGVILIILSAISWIFLTILLGGLKVVSPNEARIFTLFGVYYGTIQKPGFFFVNPFCTSFSPTYQKERLQAIQEASSNLKKGSISSASLQSSNLTKAISLKTQTLNNGCQKVNDVLGNPIVIGAVVIWHVKNATQAVFSVEDYKEYLSIQTDSTIRNIARLYPYDVFDDAEDDNLNEKSLRGSAIEIAEQMQIELQKRVSEAGLEIEEVRITHLAYAEEIAAAMLQRQQAAAIIAARQKIVDGAVGMVKMAIDKLGEDEIVVLDEERKAAMVSNLLVVLCGNKDAQPIVNSGSIY